MAHIRQDRDPLKNGDNVGYLHIDNLYKTQTILLFRECFALEKIHGTSAHVSWKDAGHATKAPPDADPRLSFHSGGEKHQNFVALFDKEKLVAGFEAMGHPEVIIFGEAYGGKQQAQSWRYGKHLKFVAFDVKVGDHWLDVTNAAQVCERLGLEFVHFVRVSTELSVLDAERDAPSEQARRNGIEGDQPREGVVLRPVREFRDTNGDRIISKHKRAEERETKTPRDANVDPAQLKVLDDAKAIADEWVTPIRLDHVLDKLGTVGMEDTPKVITAMIEDVVREGSTEIVDSKEARKAIGASTARLFKARVIAALRTAETA